ncbi:hypothetical protein BaRGS_00024506, partial [Batillaria attramentaria]
SVAYVRPTRLLSNVGGVPVLPHTSQAAILSPSCRLYHAFTQMASRRARNVKKFTLFQRGFRPNRGIQEDRRVVIRPFRDSLPPGNTGGLLGPFAFTAFPHYEKEMGFRQHMNAMWNNLSDGQKMVMGIIFLNVVVFLAWKNPHLHPVLMRYFACMPGNPSVSMLLSAFSHYNLWHIAANMYVLWSFATVSLNLFGREQWLAVYLSAAALSSLASMTNKVIRRMPLSPSLGASGAIMCLLGAVCVKFPDARLSIAFVGEFFPHSFSADSALKFIVALDAVGLFMGWKVFDHAAHLGGVLFGIWYATYGHKLIWGNRETIMKRWHEIRGRPAE